MIVHIDNQQEDLPIDEGSIAPLVEAVLALEGKPYDEVSIVFANLGDMGQIHEQHFGDPSPTDCMSFPMDEKMLGDVVVCPAVALEYVGREGGDAYEELSLYLVHGLLHLLGYDDIEEEKRVQMRAAEQRHLDNLKEQRRLITCPSSP